MAYDLAISPYGDLNFAGNRDLQGVGGQDLIEQRIKNRLRIFRGSWIYDRDRTLGSALAELTLLKPEDTIPRVNAMVREALRPMAELTLSDVQVETTDNDIWIFVNYVFTEDIDEIPVAPIQGSVSLSIPLGG